MTGNEFRTISELRSAQVSAALKRECLGDAVKRVAEMLSDEPNLTGAAVLTRLEHAAVDARTELRRLDSLPEPEQR